MTEISLTAEPAGRSGTNNCKNDSWLCSNPFRMVCTVHGEGIAIRCKRWRVCPGCANWTRDQLRRRFLAGILEAEPPRRAMFATLTFQADLAPDENEAHAAWRKLVARLRYRGHLGPYGWVLQRTRRGVLHHHAIMHMPWFDDGLAEWRRLIVASGFGPQNKLILADRRHAAYCARYISDRHASLAPMRRAYAFSRDFPQPPPLTDPVLETGRSIGLEPECEWQPAYYLFR